MSAGAGVGDASGRPRSSAGGHVNSSNSPTNAACSFLSADCFSFFLFVCLLSVSNSFFHQTLFQFASLCHPSFLPNDFGFCSLFPRCRLGTFTVVASLRTCAVVLFIAFTFVFLKAQLIYCAELYVCVGKAGHAPVRLKCIFSSI